MTKKEKEILWKMVKTIVIKRDGLKCLRCYKKGKGLHLSHLFPRGQYPKLAFEPDNCILHCMHCHLNWWHKNPIEAAEWYKKVVPTAQRNRLAKMVKNYADIKPLKYETCLLKLKKQKV